MGPQDQLGRRLRFTGSRFTLLSQRDAEKDFNLCQICLLKPNCMMHRRVQTIMDEFGIVAPITECGTYRPKLVFRPPLIGLEDKFNTIRIGGAWAQRLPAGVTVSLWDSITDREIGLARVTASLAGRWDRVRNEHAPHNHMMLEHRAGDTPQLLHKVLTRCYGTTYFHDERNVSVIYLERLHEAAEG